MVPTRRIAYESACTAGRMQLNSGDDRASFRPRAADGSVAKRPSWLGTNQKSRQPTEYGKCVLTRSWQALGVYSVARGQHVTSHIAAKWPTDVGTCFDARLTRADWTIAWHGGHVITFVTRQLTEISANRDAFISHLPMTTPTALLLPHKP